MPPSSHAKIARKMERKRQRMQRKKEEQEHKEQEKLMSEIEKMESVEEEKENIEPPCEGIPVWCFEVFFTDFDLILFETHCLTNKIEYTEDYNEQDNYWQKCSWNRS